MRADSLKFALANTSASRKPRFAIKIEYAVSSVYLTSHDDIPNVPGDVIQSVVQKPSSISQRIYPDEGRSDIGSFSFTVLDKAEALTDSLRAQLADNGAGIRGKPVKFYIGYKGFDFTDFALFTTQIVSGVTYKAGLYTVRCADITREQRKQIFKPVTTQLTASVSDTADVIPVNDTSRFEMVKHGSSYSDGPGTTVGYFRLEDEIIRYTSLATNAFVGCARGVFNTRASQHTVDAATPVSRRTKVEEFIYLEMPGPKLAYAVLTGIQYGTTDRIPDHWNLGIDPDLIQVSDFVNIGPDLWNASNDADPAPLIFRFDGLSEQDGKKFLEQQVYLLLACFSPVYSTGKLGLKRMVPIISDAVPLVTLTPDTLVSLSELEHDLDSMHNSFEVQWAYDEIADDYIRETLLVDSDSVTIHGESPVQVYKFQGLHPQRAGDTTIVKKLDSIRDRYAEPPLRLTATVLGSLNGLEVGDIVGIQVPSSILRDFTSPAGEFNRSFEIQQKTYDAVSGDVTLDLFGSTARPEALPIGPDHTPSLPDAFYNSEGVALTTIIPETSPGSKVLQTGNFTITGDDGLSDDTSIFYYLDDLTIPDGCNITLVDNVQLRVRGFLTINGDIDGTANGHLGVADPGTGSWDAQFLGNPGYIGNSRGWDGIQADIHSVGRVTMIDANTVPALSTTASVDGTKGVFPTLELSVVDDTLLGLPTDLRGTGGAPGGRIVSRDPSRVDHFLAAGGPGGDGGAGCCIISRGLALGGSASITLDGDDTTSATPFTLFNTDSYVGAGGAGGPGALLVLIDGGADLSVPNITSANFSAKSGTIHQSGNPLPKRQNVQGIAGVVANRVPGPLAGFADPAIVSNADFSAAARGIQYIPSPNDVIGNVSTLAPPTNLTALASSGGNALSWISPSTANWDVIQIYASIDNDRTNAVFVGETRGSSFFHQLPLGGLRYYWLRAKLNARATNTLNLFSTFEPSDAHAGVSSNTSTPGEVPEAPADFAATGKINGIQFTWSLPWAKLLGQIELWELGASTPFGSATRIWSGYALGVFISKADATTRYYWLVLNRNGERSAPLPTGAGLPAAAISATSDLVANAFPLVLTKSAGVPPPNPKSVSTASTTATATGGTGPYTYAWTWRTGGAGITIDNPTSATTTFSGSSTFNGTTLSGAARITITDSLGAFASPTADVSVLMNWPSAA